jgi:lysozyme
MIMEYSENGLNLTKSLEGLRLEAYLDVAGVPTIGYGHTGPEVHLGLTWTQAEADAALLEDVQGSVYCVNQAVKVPLNQNQFDALVDFTFNVGCHAFEGSTLLIKLNHSDYIGAEGQFANWKYAGGEVVPGLVRRRAAEGLLFSRSIDR